MKSGRLGRRLLAAMALAMSVNVFGAPIDDAKALYEQGDYAAALEKLQTLAKRSPRDTNVNYYLGATLLALGNEEQAVEYLSKAESRGLGAASEMLAGIAMSHYNVDLADKHLETWSANLKKARKSAPGSYDDLSSRLVNLRNMLDRVERIEVLDSIDVDSATFFDYYRLSQSAGQLVPPGALSSLISGNIAPFSPAYMPESRNELFWSAKSGDQWQLMGAGILDDGTLDHNSPLFEDVDGNAAFPFLMNDGMTLYYASDGEGSIGGYDIFMTRRNADGTYFQPQNIGMPYNSPSNDFMLAVDEASGLGWWATDRNQVPGKVTIYIYMPSEVRNNVDADNPDIESLAKLNNIALTHAPGKDYKQILQSRLPKKQKQDSGRESGRFAIDMGGGVIYTAVEDFKNSSARSTMLEAMGAEVELRSLQERLDKQRDAYRNGDKTVSNSILAEEKEVDQLRKKIQTLRNKAIRLESAR